MYLNWSGGYVDIIYLLKFVKPYIKIYAFYHMQVIPQFKKKSQ